MGSPGSSEEGIITAKMESTTLPEQPLNASGSGIPNAEKENASATAIQEASNASSPTAALASLPQRWNHPRINMWRSFASFFGFVIMGLNDSAYGVCPPRLIHTRQALTFYLGSDSLCVCCHVPSYYLANSGAQLEQYYNVSYTVVSLVFLSPLVGYTASAVLNNSIHMTFGQRGVAFIAPGVRIIAYVIISQHPPYPALVIAFILAGFSNGLEDAAWNAWMGIMQNANEILGFLHAAFGLGATLGPLIATTMVTKAHLGWYTFYYIMVGVSCIEIFAAVAAFWKETGQKFQDEHPRTSGKTGGRTREALSSRVTWICSVFLLIYVGIEVAIGGWVVVFMMKIRHAAPFAAGMSETGFWLGITVGRLVLGFVTPRIGEKLAIVVCLILISIPHTDMVYHLTLSFENLVFRFNRTFRCRFTLPSLQPFILSFIWYPSSASPLQPLLW